jgi:energy-coupling factor transporter ATP-binding protein EcfA2
MKAIDLLLRSTVMYGESNSGKSTIIYHMLKLLRPYIPTFIVVSPTAASNGDYDDRIPAVLIFKEPTKETFQAIYQRQEAAAAFYRKANKLDILESLYIKIRDKKMDNIIVAIKRKRIFAKQKVREQYSRDLAKMDAEIKSIDETHDETLRNIYRVVIRKHKDFLRRKYQLSSEQKYCLKYLDFNPNLGLIIDDCAAQIKAWGKDETIGKIFYQGRHNYITSIYTFQHDKLLDTNFRQNAFNSIFTTEKCARAYFTRGTNNFDKEEQNKVKSVLKQVFTDSDPAKKFQKFVYQRESKQPYYRFVAQTFPKFKVCYPYVQKYCELVKSTEECYDESNPFMRNFLIGGG